MAQLAIRGGVLVDGTGGPAVRADVGITRGTVVEIGSGVEADTEIDAVGRLVTPGFLDIHTHYDPQVLWDPALTPSSWHGVTGVVAGNCGYSIAPTRPRDRASLLRTLDKVEDMRVATLEAGVVWDFETYPQYLEAVNRRGTLINFGGYVGHTPVRLYVMGDDAYERPATNDEITDMRAVVAQSILGGALGFSTDRAGFHLGDGGRPVPSVTATQEETEALIRVTAEIGQGTVHVAAGEDYEWLYQLDLGRPINRSSILTYPPEARSRRSYGEKLTDHEARRRAGADVSVQVSCRPIEQELRMDEPTALYSMPAFAEFVACSHQDRHRLYGNRAWRARVQEDLDRSGLLNSRWAETRLVESPAHADLVGRAIGDIAADRRCPPFDVLCDLSVEDDMATRVRITFANDDVDGVTSLLRGEGCILGLSDAGAHVSQICDAVMPTDFLANWVRDREVMTIERGVRKLTGEIADVLELDRGYVRVGAPADIVVLDYEGLSPGPIRRVRDFPAGGERLVADHPTGIDCVLVNGVPIWRDGQHAADGHARMPGAILRSSPKEG
ncbi:MAG TPA: amidohydrolase family protein [Acidimicrobiales bacterium]